MDWQVEVLSFHVQELGRSWVYCGAMMLVETSVRCELGGGTYKILASLCRRSKNSPIWTPKTTNEVAKAVRKATRLMPSTFLTESDDPSVGICSMGRLVVVVSTLDVVGLLEMLADDVIVDAKADVIVDSTDPDMDAVDTAVDTAVGSVERSVEEAMMAGEVCWPLEASGFVVE